MGKHLIIISLSLFISLTSFGQYYEMSDSLQAAVVTDTMMVARSLGSFRTDLQDIRAVVSPLGEGDPIKWAQGLPGITTGADGSSAYYVRGGAAGNNLFSLDGVPVYGYSHLLGLTTSIPQSMMGNVTLSKGGFDGAENNFTASHLKIESRLPSEDGATSISVNNFLISISDERRVTNRTSYMVSARLSPLSPEYGLVQGLLPDIMSGLGDFKATVGDIYGKVHMELGFGKTIDFSTLGTLDDYSFSPDGEAMDRMGWNNLTSQLRYRSTGSTSADCMLYVSHYGSVQRQDKLFRGEWNHLSLNSDLTEISASADWSRGISGHLAVSWGTGIRGTHFRPGRVASVTNAAWIVLADAFCQMSYEVSEKIKAKAYLRGNAFYNLSTNQNVKDRGLLFSPDVGAFVRWQIGPHFSLEMTADKVTQYYHTLEGLPVGWNLDMIVPSGARVAPESAFQSNIGGFMNFAHHSISIGGFHKWMENLVYYKYSQSLFSSGMADWADNVDQGKGQSYGGEFLYEFHDKDWYARVAYTLSRTDRSGFQNICKGETFNARFDRRHVFNALARWKGVSAALTVQSGHWENGTSHKYDMTIPGASWVADYYSGVNDYHMPTILRLDIGYGFSFRKGRLTHDINLGLCNVTNHFNPFMIYFEAKTETWKQLALLPILPNLSWRVEF